MAYHTNNFGRHAHLVKPYADLNGFVPQPGDKPHDFTWDSQTQWTDETWAAHVEAAERAGDEAQSLLDEATQ